MKRLMAPATLLDWKRAVSRRRQHLWRLFWRRVCQRSPQLCRWLEAGRKAIFRFDPEALEAQIAALSLGAAIWLGLRALHITQNMPAAHLLLSLLPAWVWATLFTTMGLSHIGALATNRLRWRAGSAMLGVLAWSFVAGLMVLDGMIGPGTALFPIVACSEAWVYLRLTTCCFTKDSVHLSAQDMDLQNTDEVAGGD